MVKAFLETVEQYFKMGWRYLLTFLLFLVLFFMQDWHSPTYLTSNEEKNGILTFDIRTSEGLIQRKIDLKKHVYMFFQVKGNFPLTRNKIENISFKGDTSGMSLLRDSVKYKISDFSLIPDKTDKLKLVPLLSIFITSLTITLGLFFLRVFCFENFDKHKRITLVFGFTLFLFGFFALIKFQPGFFNYDSFDNYSFASTYRISTFVGSFYSLILICLYQFFHTPLLVSIMSLVVSVVILSDMFHDALINKYVKYYIPVVFAFLLIPTSIISIFVSSRDSISSWMLVYACYKIYEFDGDHQKSRIQIAYVIFIFTIALLLRQESIYAILPLVIIYAYFKKGIFLRSAIVATVLIVTYHLVFNRLLLYRNMLGFKIYESTTLISPLSEILTRKYGLPIPVHINTMLGDFFKNDYLVKHYSPFGIEPFHKGGLNNKTLESYEKFKSGSFKLFSENMDLFFQNRIRIFIRAVGLGEIPPYLLSDDFQITEVENSVMFQMREFQEYPKTYMRNLNGDMAFKWLYNLIYMYSKLSLSYLPIALLLVAASVFSKGTNFIFILSFFVSRTMIVFLTEPESMFKYNYPVYLFTILILPIFFYRKKKYLKKVSQQQQNENLFVTK